MSAGFMEMTYAEYDAIDAVRSTEIKHAIESINHWLHYRRNPQESKPHFTIGHAVHTMILEPGTFADRYITCPNVDRRTKKGREVWDRFMANSEGREILQQEDAHRVMQMTKNLHDHPTISKMFQGQSEVTLVWTDEESGMKCKCRIDHFFQRLGQLDIKTTHQKAKRKQIPYIIEKLLYHVSAAFYMDGYFANFGEYPKNFWFVFIENKPPFNLQAGPLAPTALEKGRQLYKEALQKIARWRKEKLYTGQDPYGGYSENYDFFDLPWSAYK